MHDWIMIFLIISHRVQVSVSDDDDDCDDDHYKHVYTNYLLMHVLTYTYTLCTDFLKHFSASDH